MFLQTFSHDPIHHIRIVVILIVSITLHELAHGVAALSQGDNTPRHADHMTLNPIVHMGWMSIFFLCIAGIAWGQMPVNPSKFRNPKWSNILVSAAGPASNLILGLGAILLLTVVRYIPGISVSFLYLMAQINLVLFLFNLLPIPPLDGFHIFAEFFPPLKALQNSSFGLFAMMILFIVPGLSAGIYVMAELIIQQAVGS